MPIVHSLANQYGVPTAINIGVERADLIQEGALALVCALNRYQPGQGATFWTYCYPRVRGAILDYIRNQQLASRSYQNAKKNIGEIIELLGHRNHREPTAADIRNELGCSDAHWQRITRGINALSPPLPLDMPLDHEPDDRATLGDLVLMDSTCLEEIVEQLEVVTEVRDAMAKLPPEHQVALRGRYFTHAQAWETAEKLKIKTDRVTRLNREGLDMLKAILEPS
jgi:RNA polymerase sigma factor for flagellar operon FliA